QGCVVALRGRSVSRSLFKLLLQRGKGCMLAPEALIQVVLVLVMGICPALFNNPWQAVVEGLDAPLDSAALGGPLERCEEEQGRNFLKARYICKGRLGVLHDESVHLGGELGTALPKGL